MIEAPQPRPVEERFFVYWNGAEKVLGDPLAIGRKLEAACPEYRTLLATATAQLPDEFRAALSGTDHALELTRQKSDATAKLLTVIRDAFGVKPAAFEGETVVGLSEDESAQLLLAFLAWMSRAEESARPFSTSQPRDAPSIPPDSTNTSSPGSGGGESGSSGP